VNKVDPSGESFLSDFLKKPLVKKILGGGMSWLKFGNLVHIAIFNDIKKQMPRARYGVYAEYPEGSWGFIDVLIDPEIYEIKPFGSTKDPQKQLNKYLTSNGNYVLGTYPFHNVIYDKPIIGLKIEYYLKGPGAIEYIPGISPTGNAALVSSLIFTIIKVSTISHQFLTGVQIPNAQLLSAMGYN
jgi:hypothetical protein